ncbi:MAG: hypothetical protein OEM77_04350 [Nitrosopumilus sp.]|nr:hypothetical protein [Nitrosopumilus sp.]MDH3736163.1 hypothetical protein [Nitrosopumilus sp.]MDH3833274.1 hypothetical protein [Nitrosopumilus sp.]
MTDTLDKFKILTKNSQKQTEKLIEILIKKMEKEGKINNWHKTWQRLWYVTNYAYLVLHFYEKQIMPDDPKNDIMGKLFSIRENNKEYVIKVKTNFKTILKISFLTECLFQIEFPLREINSKLSNPTKDKKIIPMTKHILKELKIPEYQKKVDAIKCPYLIRNSLHN